MSSITGRETSSSTNQPDPYRRANTTILEPPTHFSGKLRYLGPGLVLSACIVGSGELIATTTLGARAGFVTFWVILVSCAVKVTIQLEFGKHAINSGESVMAAFNRLPGPRFGKANWSIWTWLSLMSLKFLQLGGIVGGVALTLNIALPGIGVLAWAVIVAVVVSLLVFRGYYRFIERVSVVMISLFSVITIGCVLLLQYTPYALNWANILEGLRFDLPAAAVGVAIAAFGLTGVGGDEIMIYNYWCLEKGYAAFTGPRTDSPDWARRARCWIGVMYLDAILSMLLYTVVTAAFYLLGAAVLHARGVIPEGYAMIETLSAMYTETLGAGAKIVFLIGAVVVLFSTLFSALAGWIRMYADAFGQIGWIDFSNRKSRARAYAIMAWFFPLLWVVLFGFIKLPVLMVLIGGVTTSVILLLVVFAAFHFRFRRLPAVLLPTRVYDLAFWLSAAVIAGLAVYGLARLI